MNGIHAVGRSFRRPGGTPDGPLDLFVFSVFTAFSTRSCPSFGLFVSLFFHVYLSFGTPARENETIRAMDGDHLSAFHLSKFVDESPDALQEFPEQPAESSCTSKQSSQLLKQFQPFQLFENSTEAFQHSSEQFTQSFQQFT